MKLSLITLVVAAMASTIVAQRQIMSSRFLLEAHKGAMLDTIDGGNTNAIVVLLQGWLFNFLFALAL
ncbi:uncharacterized protein L3040_008263 [Drepanopeziza brunnea f. sp. 'multigermtubi']|uniref:uncharacterized protein n=1 Tax=Drepanopeziza brunnea f. sp. 'multigermtubi' TaxID=698441 RepID=UPI0023A45973|nr:hypothetical protein L3040_008263 [Drepanopeziza brunnea f. sp. 'multigermtubi']